MLLVLHQYMQYQGFEFNARHINTKKKINRKVGERLPYIIRLCSELEEIGFGSLEAVQFKYHDDIVTQINTNESLKAFIRKENVPVK